MSIRFLPMSFAPMLAGAFLALGVVSGNVHAQDAGKGETAVIPVVNNDNGRVEAVLLLEPTTDASGKQAQWRFGSNNALTAAFGLQSGDSLGLLCDRRAGVFGALSSLDHCLLASMGGTDGNASKRTSATATLANAVGKLGINIGSGQDRLPVWMAPGKRGGRVEQTDLTVFAEKNIGNTGVVSIGGTVARARLITAGESPALVDQWNSKSLSIGGGVGDFRASIIGRVVDVPGQPEQWQGLGVGLTWRTPWSGKLTVGAENVITRGRNPFAPTSSEEEDGTVPYVRYQQDL